ncbi:hypothetical protein NL387_26865, partial [Klebsiella pneumoniae]|nr:hypothetical protein [Klebsiella pneumoniae]
ANVARAVQERSSWVRDVIENYNNLERECVAAAHPVCPRLALRHLALRAHWDDLLPAAPNPPGERPPPPRLHVASCNFTALQSRRLSVP